MHEEEMIPVEKVLDDMYSSNGMISSAARSYYYIHYATEEEKQQMDREDKIEKIVSVLCTGIIGILVIGFIILVSIAEVIL